SGPVRAAGRGGDGRHGCPERPRPDGGARGDPAGRRGARREPRARPRPPRPPDPFHRAVVSGRDRSTRMRRPAGIVAAAVALLAAACSGGGPTPEGSGVPGGPVHLVLWMGYT